MLACLASTLLVVSPEIKDAVNITGLVTLTALLFGQPIYLHFRDKEALDAVMGIFMLSTGVILFALAYAFPLVGSGPSVLIGHSVIFVCLLGGWATVNGEAKSSLPKRWLFNIGAWQRQESATA